MADGSTTNIDDLIRNGHKLAAELGQTETVSHKDDIKSGSAIADAVNNIKTFNNAVNQAKGGFQMVKQFATKAWDFIKKYTPLRPYMWLYNKISYKTDKATGEKKPRIKARTFMRLSTIFLASAMLPNILGVPVGAPAREVVGSAAELVYDGARMTTMMHKDQVIYLNDQHVADHAKNLWLVKGSLNPNGNGEDGAIFYVKPSIAHDLWSWVHKGNPMFIPDQVVTPVAPGANNPYLVTYYGTRWRVATWLQAYPELLDVRKLTPAEAEAFNKAAHPPAAQTQEQTQTQAPAAAPVVKAPVPAAPAR